MAATVTHGDFTAWVEIGSEETTLYSPKVNDETNTTTCWLPSQAGKNFSIHWRDNILERKEDTCGWVIVDDLQCTGAIIFGSREDEPGRRLTSTRRTAKTFAYRTSDTTANRLIFEPVAVAGENDTQASEEGWECLGTIRLDIYRVKVGNKGKHEVRDAPATQPVHERAKKDGTHRTKVAGAVTKPLLPYYQLARNGPPLASFIFNYRPIERLRADGVVPRAEKRKMSAQPGAPDSDSDDGIQLLETPPISGSSAAVSRPGPPKSQPGPILMRRVEVVIPVRKKPRVKRESMTPISPARKRDRGFSSPKREPSSSTTLEDEHDTEGDNTPAPRRRTSESSVARRRRRRAPRERSPATPPPLSASPAPYRPRVSARDEQFRHAMELIRDPSLPTEAKASAQRWVDAYFAQTLPTTSPQ